MLRTDRQNYTYTCTDADKRFSPTIVVGVSNDSIGQCRPFLMASIYAEGRHFERDLHRNFFYAVVAQTIAD